MNDPPDLPFTKEPSSVCEDAGSAGSTLTRCEGRLRSDDR
jgi:hypothetical protein